MVAELAPYFHISLQRYLSSLERRYLYCSLIQVTKCNGAADKKTNTSKSKVGEASAATWLM